MYYGIDSDTAVFPTGATTHNFYIGRLGYGTTTDFTYFNNTGSSLATYSYGYWGLEGPSKDPNYNASTYGSSAAHAWGSKQADAAFSAWENNSHVNRNMIFADIEAGFGGWLLSDSNHSNYPINYAVFQGFVDNIASRQYFYPGVYVAPGPWKDYMLTDSPTYSNTTVWSSYWPSGLTFNTPPTSISTSANIAGVTPTMWQYFGVKDSHNDKVTGDANVATSLPL